MIDEKIIAQYNIEMAVHANGALRFFECLDWWHICNANSDSRHGYLRTSKNKEKYRKLSLCLLRRRGGKDKL